MFQKFFRVIATFYSFSVVQKKGKKRQCWERGTQDLYRRIDMSMGLGLFRKPGISIMDGRTRSCFFSIGLVKKSVVVYVKYVVKSKQRVKLRWKQKLVSAVGLAFLFWVLHIKNPKRN